MEKDRLLLFPLIIGMILIVYSWFLSYPLSIVSLDDFVFNHVSILYWVGLPLTLTSLCMITMRSKNTVLKWIMIVGIFLAITSLSYFYSMLPGSDSHFTRGMVEYLHATKNLDPLQPNKTYFQWPSFFILADIAWSVTGLNLASIEFITYAFIGFVLASALYIYALKADKNNGFLAVIAYFIAMFSYLDYQLVPFSLAFALLLLLLVLERRREDSTRSLTIVMLVLFTAISTIHAFVPIFFILFLLARAVVSRNRRDGKLCLMTTIVYLTVQFVLAPGGFASNIWGAMNAPSGYSGLTGVTSVSVPIDSVAQRFSVATTMVTGAICLVGFVALLVKRRATATDKAIFLSGAFYLGLGFVIYNIGSRAIPLIFIPVSLGVCYLLETRFRTLLKCVFLVLLLLFVTVPLHASFYKGDIMFQSNEAYNAENFFIDHFNWTIANSVLADFRVMTYLESRMTGNVYFTADPQKSREVDVIVYTLGLGLYLSGYNYTIYRVLYEESLNVVYDNGLSIVATRSSNFTWAPVFR